MSTVNHLPRLPPKLTRFIIVCSVDKKYRKDALIAFDEAYVDMVGEFGITFAIWWSWQQAIRSIPYKMIVLALPAAGIALKLAFRLMV